MAIIVDSNDDFPKDNSASTTQSISTPYVNWKSKCSTLYSDDVAIFEATKSSIIDSLFVSNIGNHVIQFNLYVMKNREGSTARFDLIKALRLEIGAQEDLIKDSIFYLEVGDALFAHNSDSSGKATVWVSYRELNNQQEV